MKVQVLGVGNAFSPELGNSSVIIWENTGNGFLIDCGFTIFPELKELNLLHRVSKFFLTHRHMDHSGSLDTFLYYKRFILNQKVSFFGFADHIEFLKMIDPKFDTEAEDYFNMTEEQRINTIPTKQDYIPSDAFFNYGVLYSGDTSQSLLDTPEATDARLVLHEVCFGNNSMHTSFEDLKRASNVVKAKTHLYHYGSGDYEKYNETVMHHGFAGMLRKGELLEI